jgi:hypothetical protein
MEKERRSRIINNLLQVAQESNQDHANLMTYQVAVQSKNLGELNDIITGVRSQENHPHHPVHALRSSIARSWINMRKLRAEIQEFKNEKI